MRHARRWMLLLVIVSALFAGCPALQTERGRWHATAEMYGGVKSSLDKAWEAGELSRTQQKAVIYWTREADAALEAWRNAIEKGEQPPEGEYGRLKQALRVLRDLLEDTGRDKDGTEHEAGTGDSG